MSPKRKPSVRKIAASVETGAVPASAIGQPRMASVCYYCRFITLRITGGRSSGRCARRRCTGATYVVRGAHFDEIAAGVVREAVAIGASAAARQTLIENLAHARERFTDRRLVTAAVLRALPEVHPLTAVHLARFVNARRPIPGQLVVVLDAQHPPGPTYDPDLPRRQPKRGAGSGRDAAEPAGDERQASAGPRRPPAPQQTAAERQAAAARARNARTEAQRARLDPGYAGYTGPATPPSQRPVVRRRQKAADG